LVTLSLSPCCGQSIFERGAAGRSDPDAASLDRHAIGLAGRVLCCCKPGVHKISQRAACEAMRAHNCTGGAEWNAGEQSQRPTLFRPDMTFSKRRCHHLVVAKVHFFVECLKKPCFATAVPGLLLRDLSNETGDRRDPGPPKGIRKGDLGVAYGAVPPVPRTRKDTTRAPLGIPWAEKWRQHR
jgi:hypothetical protein